MFRPRLGNVLLLMVSAAGLAPESVTRVLMNPPFNDPARQRASPDRQRRLAHAGPDGTLAAWIKTAARLLRPGGTLTLIWRADGLAAVLKALDAAFGAVTVFPIHSKAGEPAIRILVRAAKATFRAGSTPRTRTPRATKC